MSANSEIKLEDISEALLVLKIKKITFAEPSKYIPGPAQQIERDKQLKRARAAHQQRLKEIPRE